MIDLYRWIDLCVLWLKYYNAPLHLVLLETSSVPMTALSTEAGTLTKIREHAADVVRVARKIGGGLEKGRQQDSSYSAGMNTCKHWLERGKNHYTFFYERLVLKISYSVSLHFLHSHIHTK